MVEGPTLSSILSRADLCRAVPENTKKLSEKVVTTENRIEIGDHQVFYREARPPDNHYAKGTIFFLHGQSFSSSTWTENGLLSSIAAHGFHCVAPDLPGSGKTFGPAIPNEDKPTFFLSLLSALGVKQPMIVAASMSAQYVLPLLNREIFSCVVGVALSNTHELTEVHKLRTPLLCVWGDKDTSLGPSSANNLKNLPNSRLQQIPSAGHAAHLGNPDLFQRVVANFVELIRSYHTIPL
ncbi:unnamed protein product, partial [Mesorhabditis belari]|uniref:AB hydrolase-1 domain-containing protein n=1 Tax=Mesorhabditis belari TaxID=2138241 RepID=A0AAF3FES9_9BILA